MTTIHHSPPPGATPFVIYEDAEDQEPPSPSEVYDGDVSFASEMSSAGPDVAIPSIESGHGVRNEPEPHSSSYTSRRSFLSSPRNASGMTANSFVSSLPSEISIAAPPANLLESRYSPRKERPPFRNPSSVRALQMASPPPLPPLEAPRERIKGSYKLASPSRNGRSDSVSTTGTRRSRPHRDSLHGEYQAQHSPRPTPTPQPLPLVLLHVTILPMQIPYTPDIMVKIMPEWLVENYKVLEEKLQDIVLMRRGLLIQHPRDEYDVLEERILESLELKTPRLLKCGHFVGPDADFEEDPEDDDVEEIRSVTCDATGRGSRMSGGTITAEEEAEYRYPTPTSDDASVCVDCHRQVKKPGNGVGAGTKRWDIKIYAANGLMRAGAWMAAWSEMERCDVEIAPWIPNEVRKTLEKRLEQEQEAVKNKALYAAELQRQIAEEAAIQKKLDEEAEAKRRTEEAERQRLIEAEAAEKRHLEESLNEKIEEAKEAIRLEFEAQALAEANCVAERFRAMEEALKHEQQKATAQTPSLRSRSRSRSQHRIRSVPREPRVEEIPLGTLLKNYVVLQLQDSRNFFILLLSALVVFLLMNSTPEQPLLDLTPVAPLEYQTDVARDVSPLVVTSTATMTTTSTSILVITEVQSLESAQETFSSSSDIEQEEPSAVESIGIEAPTPSERSVSEQETMHEALDSTPTQMSPTGLEPSSSTDTAWEDLEPPQLSTSEPTLAVEVPSAPVEYSSSSTTVEQSDAEATEDVTVTDVPEAPLESASLVAEILGIEDDPEAEQTAETQIDEVQTDDAKIGAALVDAAQVEEAEADDAQINDAQLHDAHIDERQLDEAQNAHEQILLETHTKDEL